MTSRPSSGSPEGAGRSSAASGAARTRRTAILSKQPVPGQVKTRLCPPLDPGQAAGLAEAMLRDAVERCMASRAFRTVLWFAPAGAGDWFRGAFPGLELAAQRGPDLAWRLRAVVEDELRDAATDTLVAIGSDQPLLSTGRITEAHARLEGGADLVLGPDAGGGYDLVGMRAPHGELFTSVEMSTAGMCAETVRLAEARGLGVALLEPGLDVDVEADLMTLRAELARSSPDSAEFPRHTAAFLSDLALSSP